MLDVTLRKWMRLHTKGAHGQGWGGGASVSMYPASSAQKTGRVDVMLQDLGGCFGRDLEGWGRSEKELQAKHAPW